MSSRGLVVVAVAVVLGWLLLRSVSTPDDVGRGNSARSPSTTVGHVTSTVPASTVPSHAAADVKVLVFNAVDPKKTIAGPAAAQLVAAGFTQVSAKDAAQSTATAVYFTAGYDVDAAQIAAALHLAPTTVQLLPSPVPSAIAAVTDANVVVVLGPDAASGSG